MTQILGASDGAVDGGSQAAVRCAVSARGRGDELLATAPPARRFLLLETPGPWLPEAMTAAGLGAGITTRLRAHAAGAGVRILLIRRPGRHPVEPGRPHRWGLASLPAAGAPAGLHWSSWQRGADLLDLDLGAALPTFDDQAQRPVALVCTHGRHDLCCAVEGRPVAAAAALDSRADVWECSHLGGDRFAANLLWLPSGLLFGGLDAASTGPVLDAAVAGRVVLDHFRGRCGDPALAQAAQWHLMRELGEDRPDDVVFESFEPAGADQDVVLRHGPDRYRIRLATSWSEPQHLTCRARTQARARLYRPIGPPVRL